MNVINEIVKIWNSFDTELSKLIETRLVCIEKSHGKVDKFSQPSIENILILDSNLNQIHIIREKEKIELSTYLITPQPLELYTSMDITTGFILLWGNNNVGIIDIDSFKPKKICKKITEVLFTKELILKTKWYPNSSSHFVILTQYSIHVINWKLPLNFHTVFRYSLISSDVSFNKSFGYFDKFVSFDFGSSSNKSKSDNDYCVFVLKESGEVLRLPELSELIDYGSCFQLESCDDNNDDELLLKMKFLPVSSDNYDGHYFDISILRGYPIDIMVLLVLNDNNNYVVHHGLIVGKERICIYERINFGNNELVYQNNEPNSEFLIFNDKYSCPPRYMIFHEKGIHSVILPWVVSLRYQISSSSHSNISEILKECGSSIVDRELFVCDNLRMTSTSNNQRLSIPGLLIEREPMRPTKLHVYINNKNKKIDQHVINLRNELSFITDHNELNDSFTKLNEFQIKNYKKVNIPNSQFMKCFLEQLGRPGRLVACINDGSVESEQNALSTDIDYVLRLSDKVTVDMDSRLTNAGTIITKRRNQLEKVAQLQLQQLSQIQKDSKHLLSKAQDLTGKLKRIKLRLSSLETSLIELESYMNSYGVNMKSCREDKQASQKISDLKKQITVLSAVYRSCQVRMGEYEQKGGEGECKERKKGNYIEEIDLLQPFLKAESEDISELVKNLQHLIRIN